MTRASQLISEEYQLLYLNEPPNDFAITFDYFGTLCTLIGFTPIATYNLFFIISLTLSGLFTYLLARMHGMNDNIAFLAGFIYMSSNYSLNHYFWGHPNLWQMQWIPLIFYLVEKTMRDPSVVNTTILGFSLALQVYSTIQYTIYMSFILPAYVITRSFVNEKDKRFRWKKWRGLINALIISIIISGPYMLLRSGLEEPVRTIISNNRPSLSLSSIMDLINPDSPIYMGIIQTIFMITGIYYITRKRISKKNMTYIPYIAILIIAVTCMIGPKSVFLPYYWLYHIWPFVSYLGVPNRLFPFALLSISLLTGHSVEIIMRKHGIKKPGTILVAGLIILIITTHYLTSDYMINRHIFIP